MRVNRSRDVFVVQLRDLNGIDFASKLPCLLHTEFREMKAYTAGVHELTLGSSMYPTRAQDTTQVGERPFNRRQLCHSAARSPVAAEEK